MLERDDSPWYPSMRIFRQRRLGDWEEVFEQMAKALAEAAGKHPRIRWLKSSRIDAGVAVPNHGDAAAELQAVNQELAALEEEIRRRATARVLGPDFLELLRAGRGLSDRREALFEELAAGGV